jgi:hypothetical protein
LVAIDDVIYEGAFLGEELAGDVNGFRVEGLTILEDRLLLVELFSAVLLQVLLS